MPGAMLGFSVASQRLHEERSVTSTAAPVGTERFGRVPGALPVSAGASPATAARRRQVVSVLVGAMAFFFLVGIIPAARILWDLGLLAFGCTAAYVALLIHFHRLAVERAQKVIALETRRHVTAELESRRHVIALDRAQQAAVGGGYAGFAAAVTLAAAGRAVTVFESASTLGGRARRVEAYSVAVDNGQHILLGAYAQTLALIRPVHGAGAEHELLDRRPLCLNEPGVFRLAAPLLPGMDVGHGSNAAGSAVGPRRTGAVLEAVSPFTSGTR